MIRDEPPHLPRGTWGLEPLPLANKGPCFLAKSLGTARDRGRAAGRREAGRPLDSTVDPAPLGSLPAPYIGIEQRTPVERSLAPRRRVSRGRPCSTDRKSTRLNTSHANISHAV